MEYYEENLMPRNIDAINKPSIVDVKEIIIKELTEKISKRVIQVLEENYEIIPKKPVLKVSDEYRKVIEWEPLVRCKDCKDWNMGICTKLNKAMQSQNWCECGKREKDEHACIEAYASVKRLSAIFMGRGGSDGEIY